MARPSAPWVKEPRPFANFVGLEPEVEWLLARRSEGGEPDIARALYLNADLLGSYEYERFPERAPRPDAKLGAAPRALAASVAQEPPLSFMLSPAPGIENGEALLEALDEVAQSGAWAAMTEAERARLRQNGVAGGLCDAAFVEEAAKLGFAALPKAMRLSSALRERAAPPRASKLADAPTWMEGVLREAFDASPLKDRERPVVVGVIDDGFAIGHPRFRFDRTTSRIFSFWDQDADHLNTATDPPGFAPTAPFGRELLSVNPGDMTGRGRGGAPDMPGLDAALQEAAAIGLPESEFYTLPAMRPFFPPRPTEALRLRSHGTHVLDLAAGAPTRALKGMPPTPVASEAPALVLVRLPRRSVQETSGAHLEFYLLQGVRHILSRATMLHPEARVVIVSSYGFFGGPHDGVSQIERALDDEIAQRPGRAEIVLPSGNGRLARAHALRRFDQTPSHVLPWRVLPDDRTSSVMEIWSEPYPDGTTPHMSLSIEAPDGGAASPALSDVDLTTRLAFKNGAGTILAQAVCVHPVMHPGRRLFLIWLRPTAISGPVDDPTPAPSGVWSVRLTALTPGFTHPARVWVRRDDSLEGFASGGRQSGVERDGPRRADDPNLGQHAREVWGDVGWAQRSETLSKIASGNHTVIVGGFVADPAWKFPTPSSAGGPVAPRPDPTAPARQGPDSMAPSQRAAQQGVLGAGFFGGGRVGYRGTSVAAPLVASELAAAIGEAGYGGGREFVAVAATASEQTMPARSSPSEALGGAGRYLTDAMRNRVWPLIDG